MSALFTGSSAGLIATISAARHDPAARNAMAVRLHHPPVFVRRIVRVAPTTVPVLASVKATPTKAAFVGLDWRVQLMPPSVVSIIRPSPQLSTDVHVLASVQETSQP